jgi:hypothetical protein
MRTKIIVVAAILGLLVAGGAMAAPGDAERILAEAKAAVGGAAWDKITGWHETGEHDGIAYETELDLQRYGMVSWSTRDGKTSVAGYDGRTAWRIGPDGTVDASQDPARLADARQSAYASAYLFFMPDRFPATFSYVGERDNAGRHFDVVDIQPQDSKPMEIWVDRDSHLITRLVDPTASPPLSAEASDFRDVGGGVVVPFQLVVTDGVHTQTAHVTAITLGPLPRSDFAPPPPN